MATDKHPIPARSLLTVPAAAFLLALLPLVGGLGACSQSTLVSSHNVGPEHQFPVRGTSYYLPKRILRVEVWRYVSTEDVFDKDGRPVLDEQNNPTTRVVRGHFAMFDDERDVKTIPDLRHQFVLRPQWDSASDDYVKVNLDSDGLLAGVYGHATDERGEIARGLTDLFSMLIAGPGSTSKWDAGPRPDPRRSMTDRLGDAPRMIAEYEFDPVDPNDKARVERALKHYGITMWLHRQSDCPIAGSGPGCCTTCDCTKPGVYYRLPVPYRFGLRPAGRFREPGYLGARGDGAWENLEGGIERTLLLPNEAVCLYVPVNRASFVSSYTSLVFERGMLREVETDKPSELVGFVKIPVDVASAILAIPAELLTIRINRIEQRSDLAAKVAAQSEAERSRIESEIAMLEAARKLRGGGDGDGGNGQGGGAEPYDYSRGGKIDEGAPAPGLPPAPLPPSEKDGR